MHSDEFDRLLAAVRKISVEVAARHADEVDAQARFPAESVAALRDARVLSAAVPASLGGFGCTMTQLGTLCATMAQGCSASGMVLAMHLIEVACIARHGLDSPYMVQVLKTLVEQQTLIASVTSEVGTSGDTRSSVCAVQRDGKRFTLEKAATTVSYGQHADALLVTARRAPDAAAGDQVLVYLEREDYTLTATSNWDTLGMRGTCSPGGKLVAQGPVERIVPGSFADSAAQSMVPYSHILWSALWWGIASDAISRAAAFVRAAARRDPGSMPPAATALAQATADLQSLHHHWAACAAEFDALADDPAGRDELMTMGWGLKMNNLKIGASEAAPRIVHQALQVIGVMGYKNDSKFSVGRHYRDSLSAALMISNERLAAKSASMLLVLKEA
ncbi:MAG TPA: acyl-CoA dehydrogenase family protein [Burkholderiaceae bacterium]|jgi:acyl-CoA dehydrogenase